MPSFSECQRDSTMNGIPEAMIHFEHVVFSRVPVENYWGKLRPTVYWRYILIDKRVIYGQLYIYAYAYIWF